MERETFPGLLAAGAPVFGVVDDADWLDLGTPLAFVKGSAELVLGERGYDLARSLGVLIPRLRACRTLIHQERPSRDDDLSTQSSNTHGRKLGALDAPRKA